MPPLTNEYQVYIFDCDGVIFNSNQLKIDAMKNALQANFSDKELIENCLNYFRNNFGKSRFHHVNYFLNSILKVSSDQIMKFNDLILNDFSNKCRDLYLSAELTPGFAEFLEQCKGKRYVASGSEQDELREVFIKRDIYKLFDGVLGSPTPKSELVKEILYKENTTNAVMFGDSESDMFAAQDNGIDFVFYSPFSNVKDRMLSHCELHEYKIVDDFSKLRF
ncbi:HAD family hydrolase [Vibrio fluvialis]|nr:HAD family hydrolase [Vibrio fluvialis]